MLAFKQDVLAKVLTLNLTSILAALAQWMAKRLYARRRREYQVNFANALSKMKDNLVRLLSLDGLPALLQQLVSPMAMEAEAIPVVVKKDVRKVRPLFACFPARFSGVVPG